MCPQERKRSIVPERRPITQITHPRGVVIGRGPRRAGRVRTVRRTYLRTLRNCAFEQWIDPLAGDPANTKKRNGILPNVTTTRITEIATETRRVLDSMSANRQRCVLRIEAFLHRASCRKRFRFPHNWCDFASCVLATQLLADDCIAPDLLLVRGESEQIGRHWWLRHSDIDIDITADQFGCSTIIVEPQSVWHRETFEHPHACLVSKRNLQCARFEILLAMLNCVVYQKLDSQRAKRFLCDALERAKQDPGVE